MGPQRNCVMVLLCRASQATGEATATATTTAARLVDWAAVSFWDYYYCIPGCGMLCVCVFFVCAHVVREFKYLHMYHTQCNGIINIHCVRQWRTYCRTINAENNSIMVVSPMTCSHIHTHMRGLCNNILPKVDYCSGGPAFAPMTLTLCQCVFAGRIPTNAHMINDRACKHQKHFMRTRAAIH